MSPPRDQLPIDMSTIGRDQMLVMLGELLATAKQGAVDRSRLEQKLDDLGGMAVRLDGNLREYVAKDNAAHDRLTDQINNSHARLSEQITRLTQVLGDEESELGIVSRLRAVEDKQKAVRNLSLGAIFGSAIGGAGGLGAAVYAAGKKLGFWLAVLAVLSALAGSIALARRAAGAPPAGADPNSELGAWFQGLRQPGTGSSCCSLSDCRATDYRELGDRYEVLVDEKWGVAPPAWVEVPPDKILTKIDNPTGRGVLCYRGARYAGGHEGGLPMPSLVSPDRVLCFVRPAET